MKLQDFIEEQRKDPEYLKAEAELNRAASKRYFDLCLEMLSVIDYTRGKCDPSTPIGKLIGPRRMKAFRKELEK